MVGLKKRIQYGGVVINSKNQIRQCISCRNQFPREQLIRIVKTTDPTSSSVQIVLNPTKFQLGRSAYICNSQPCVDLAIKGKKVEKMLRTSLKGFDSVVNLLGVSSSKERVAYV